jgi:hypothetical protein
MKDCHGRSIDRMRAEDRLRARGPGWALDQDRLSASAEELAVMTGDVVRGGMVWLVHR